MPALLGIGIANKNVVLGLVTSSESFMNFKDQNISKFGFPVDTDEKENIQFLGKLTIPSNLKEFSHELTEEIITTFLGDLSLVLGDATLKFGTIQLKKFIEYQQGDENLFQDIWNEHINLLKSEEVV